MTQTKKMNYGCRSWRTAAAALKHADEPIGNNPNSAPLARLREHATSLRVSPPDALSGVRVLCSLLWFSGAKEIGRVRGRLESEILEAGSINVTKDISVLSVHLSGRELSYLASSWSWELFYIFTPSKSILFVYMFTPCAISI